MTKAPLAGTAGLVLAGGEGRRFGGPKALVVHEGERLVDRAVRVLRDAGCEPIVVVAGAAPLEVDGALVVDNPQWASGMGSSLRAGLASMPPQARAVVVLLVDTLEVSAEAVRRVGACVASGAQVAVATYDGERGHPVVIARAQWPEVARLATGDEGARPFMRANPELVVQVPCDGWGSPLDIDTPEDLQRLG